MSIGELVGKPDPRMTADEPGGPDAGLRTIVAGAGVGDGDAEVRAEDAGLGVGDGAAITAEEPSQQPATIAVHAAPIRAKTATVLHTQ